MRWQSRGTLFRVARAAKASSSFTTGSLVKVEGERKVEGSFGVVHAIRVPFGCQCGSRPI